MTPRPSLQTREALRAASAWLAAGKPIEALRLLRDASGQHPGDLVVACALARALLGQGEINEALHVLLLVARHGAPLSTEYWMLLGHAHMVMSEPDAAATAFRTWLQLEPGNLDARMRLAAALADSRHAAEAETEIRHCIAAGVRTTDTVFVLARALMGQGRYAEAEQQLRDVVRARPDHETAQGNLSELVWMRTGDTAAASEELDATLRGHPEMAGLRIIKARLLLSAQQASAALAEIDVGLALAPDNLALLNAGSTIALEFDAVRAQDYARRALQTSPADRGALTVFGNASLAVGDARQALDVATRLLTAFPYDGQLLAMRADALRMLGDERCREWLDYSHFVRATVIDTPAGWPDLTTYLVDLQAALERAHTLKAHPIGNSLRRGSQVELVPEQSPEAAVRAFPQAIDGPIRHYMRTLGTGADVMRSRNTGHYRISGMWSVRLRPNGFHVNHYHPAGWISSACYLHLPPAVDQRSGEGWLQFGQPAFPTSPALQPEYILKPEPGLLALFPSYMWHGTIPFRGSEADSRLTIAFDVLPSTSE
jgi:tetratricopeptide (TPR) repeat protein